MKEEKTCCYFSGIKSKSTTINNWRYEVLLLHTYTATGSLNLPNCWIWNIKSPPFTYSITKNKRSCKNMYKFYIQFLFFQDILTIVWKQECNWTRKGGFSPSARTRFSIMVHSTSSSWMITSFLSILMAYNSSLPLRSASKT